MRGGEGGSEKCPANPVKNVSWGSNEDPQAERPSALPRFTRSSLAWPTWFLTVTNHVNIENYARLMDITNIS